MKFTKFEAHKFRHISEQPIELGCVITAIGGQKGTGKSTSLGWISKASDFKNKSKTLLGTPFKSKYSEIFRFCPEKDFDKFYNASLYYEYSLFESTLTEEPKKMTNSSLTNKQSRIIRYFLFSVFIFFISCGEKPESRSQVEKINKIEKNEIPTFLIYGEIPPVGYLEEQDSSIAKKFGFNIKRVAGCDVTEELVDSIKKINQKNDQIMQLQFGKDWKREFEIQTNLKISIPDI